MPATFAVAHENQTVVIGSRAVVVCRAIGDRPIAVEWSRNERRLDRSDESADRFKVSHLQFRLVGTINLDFPPFSSLLLVPFFAFSWEKKK